MIVALVAFVGIAGGFALAALVLEFEWRVRSRKARRRGRVGDLTGAKPW